MQAWKAQNGFTLVEVLIASAILALVMVGALTLVASNHDAYRRGMTIAETQQHARVALQKMDRELRMAGYDLSGVLETLTSPTSIQSAEQGDLSFVADVTGDGVLDQVTYRLSGTDLVRDIASWNGSSFSSSGSGELAGNVSLLVFSYFDDTTPTNNAISAPVASGELADIRRVTISLVTSEQMAGTHRDFPMVTDVKLRN